MLWDFWGEVLTNHATFSLYIGIPKSWAVCRKSGPPESTMWWGSLGHYERPSVGLPVSWFVLGVIPAQAPYSGVTTRPEESSHSTLPCWGLRCGGADIGHPPSVLSKFLKHRTPEKNQWVNNGYCFTPLSCGVVVTQQQIREQQGWSHSF